jgi:hypothetical protein
MNKQRMVQTLAAEMHAALATVHKAKARCHNWDSYDAQPVYHNGKCIGSLVPRMTQEQIAASPGIQGWSAPKFDTRGVQR